ncbi:MAG: hypothetical protein ACW98K_00930 [Candidatus Kariarchaeaceae archaeon]|jgi:hypothetical protein
MFAISNSNSNNIKNLRKMIILIPLVLLFSSPFAGFHAKAASQGSEIMVLYDPADTTLSPLVDQFIEIVAMSYSSIEAKPVYTTEDLDLQGRPWAIVYFLHGDYRGISIGNREGQTWESLGATVQTSKTTNHIFASCQSIALNSFVDSSKELHTIVGEVDAKILMIEALFGLSTMMAESSDPQKVQASSEITQAALQFIFDNISEFFTMYFLPRNPMLTLPTRSGFGGPVGSIIDFILEKIAEIEGKAKNWLPGDEFTNSVSLPGFGGASGSLSLSFGLDWTFSIKIISADTFEGSVLISYSTAQEGFPKAIMGAFPGVSINVEGEATFTLKVISEPSVRVKILGWGLRLKIILAKEIGLLDLINVLWPGAAAAINKIPKKIRRPLLKQLNKVIIEPYLGAEFAIYSNPAGDDDFQFTIFLGVNAYTKIIKIKLSAGIGTDLEFHFTSGGNFFVATVHAKMKADVPWPFKDLKKTWKNSWKFGPGSSEGRQMNGDSDRDGLSDSFEIELGTNPNNADSDGDGLDDGDERENFETDPLVNDTDNDNFLDGAEAAYYNSFDVGGNPLGDYDDDGKVNIRDEDSDGDGLLDGDEVNGLIAGPHLFTASPLSVDSDGDGLSDSEEIAGYQIMVNNNMVQTYSNPSLQDSDNDGIFDKREIALHSDPMNDDTDGDLLKDGDELNTHFTKLNDSHSDDDLLNDYDEVIGSPITLFNPTSGQYVQVIVTSNPNLNDTDGDGLDDYEEVNIQLIEWLGTPDFQVFSDPNYMDTEDRWGIPGYADGVSDWEEVNLGEDGFMTKPDVNDSDGDGLLDNEFFVHRTYPNVTDTDSDNLDDGLEVNKWSSDPLNNDTDGDGLEDGFEIDYFNDTFDMNFNETSNYDTDQAKGILDFDSDDGGVKDGDELKSTILNGTYVWDPTNSTDDAFADSDGDGLPNQWEEAWAAQGANLNPDEPNSDFNGPNDGEEDFDGDGLNNRQEYEIGTSPINNDTDGDGLYDGVEVNDWQSDPLAEDSDQDGITDLEEIGFFTAIDIAIFTNNTNYDGDGKYGINDPDSDNDGLLDGQERSLRQNQHPLLDPTSEDSDGDNLNDGEEVLLYHTNPTTQFTDPDLLDDYEEVIVFGTNPLDPDTDHDGLDDWEEVVYWNSNPFVPDTDGDGLEDGFEVDYFRLLKGAAFINTTDYDGDGLNSIQDPDSDTDYTYIDPFSGLIELGLTDAEEFAHGTDPGLDDSDFDGLNDYIEVYGYGFNILVDPADPASPSIPLLYYTNPLDNDTDDDGLLDGDEVLGTTVVYRGQTFKYFTDPTSRDTDMDGLTDGIEVAGIPITVMGQNMTVKTNPEHPDTDRDRISDLEEIISWNYHLSSSYPEEPRVLDGLVPRIGITDFDDALPPAKVQAQVTPYFSRIAALRIGYITDPTNNDTDGDTLLDGEEKYDSMVLPTTYTPTRTIDTATVPLLTAPTNNDTDGDGLTDGEEVKTYLTNPLLRDTDRDGLPDLAEIATFSTNPHSYDSDLDQLSDKHELQMEYHNSTLSPINMTDPLNPDSDADGLTDGYEVNFLSTHPLDNDTDEDGLLDGEEVTDFGTDPFLSDTDSDGLLDSDEITLHFTDPLDADSDDDGILDGIEVNSFQPSDPFNADENGDGVLDGWHRDYDNDSLSDYEETMYFGTNPAEADTDDDGLSDGLEKQYLESWGADPGGDLDRDGEPNLLDTDSDNDGIPDVNEYGNGTNPTSIDTDGDGIGDYNETLFYLTDPLSMDTDGDGIYDDIEILEYGTDPLNPDEDGDGDLDGLKYDFDEDGLPDYNETVLFSTDPKNPDTDGDGLSDGDEDFDGDGLSNVIESNVYGTNPLHHDTDVDGLSDSDEVNIHHTDPLNPDTDGDGLTDFVESLIPTDPLKSDTDGDGLSDGDELEKGTNPLDSDTDGDLWDDGSDPNPTNSYVPNTFVAIPVTLIPLLIAGLVFRQQIGSFVRRRRGGN